MSAQAAARAFPGPLRVERWAPSARPLAGALPAELGAERPSDLFATVAVHPPLLQKLWELLALLFTDGALTPRQRELVALRTAVRCGCAYEWRRHLAPARAAGVTDAQLDGLFVGPGWDGWDVADDALVRAVDQILDDGTIGHDLAGWLAQLLDDRQLVELPLLAGTFAGVCALANAAGLDRDASDLRRRGE